jgi:hypothetical protein
MSPEEKAKSVKLANEVHEAAVAAREKMVAAVAATPAGLEFLKYLHEICGQDQSSVYISPQTMTIDPMGTTFNEVRRRVYLQVRAYIPVEARRCIENPIEIKEEKK